MMGRLVAVAGAVGALAGLWWLLDGLSSDAIGLGLGVLFGVLASLPATALVMAARSRQGDAGGGYTVRHEHTHRLDRAELEAAYRAGVAAGQEQAHSNARALVDVRP